MPKREIVIYSQADSRANICWQIFSFWSQLDFTKTLWTNHSSHLYNKHFMVHRFLFCSSFHNNLYCKGPDSRDHPKINWSSVVFTTTGVVVSLRRHRRDALTPQLRKRSVAIDGGRIPQLGRPRVAWNRERTRALLSVDKLWKGGLVVAWWSSGWRSNLTSRPRQMH